MTAEIKDIRAREILDSRGNPTIEVEVTTEGGSLGRAAVPSGASVGRYEAVELRDGGRRYHGKGVLKAVTVIEEVIAPKLVGVDVRLQRHIDQLMVELDDTENKSRLGGNAILGVSLACAKAAAAADDVELYEYVARDSGYLLPMPFFNVINGGKHAGNQLEFQEFMAVPIGAETFVESIRMGSEVYHELKKQLLSAHGRSAINVGDEGGFSPPISRPEEALEAILRAVEETGYSDSTALAVDVAATSFHKQEGGYDVGGRWVSKGELIDFYRELVGSYPVVSLEDPLHEDDFEGFAEVTRELPIQILGDDIFVTNSTRLKMGIEMGAANALVWKVNQIGTLTEALDTAALAEENGYAVQASHRSGDTEDIFVADLAVAIGCGQIKAGAPCRGERTAKYNRLLRIEERLGERAIFPKGLFS